MTAETQPDIQEEDEGGRSAFTSPFENGGLFARSILPGPGFVEASDDDQMPKLVGRLAVFDEWAEIRSSQEGTFMEKLSRGAFTKTLRDNRKVPVLYQHGEDPQIGAKPLGTITRLQETNQGVEYEVSLFDVDYVHSILPALRAGELGSSFTFRPVKDKQSITPWPQRSGYNPDRLPEVVHHEVKMLEFGPGIMPYYAGAIAGVRSATDELLLMRFRRDPERLQQLLQSTGALPIVSAETALSSERAGETHSDVESRNVPLVPVRQRFKTDEDFLDWCASALK